MEHAHDIGSHLKKYYLVYLVLLVLTIVTVGVSLFHLPVGAAVALALVVASVKGSLVGIYFMHLNDERRPIYMILGLTSLLFLHLLLIPTFMFEDNISDRDDRTKLGYDYIPGP